MGSVGYVPFEEYCFFVIQTFATTLWFLAALERSLLQVGNPAMLSVCDLVLFRPPHWGETHSKPEPLITKHLNAKHESTKPETGCDIVAGEWQRQDSRWRKFRIKNERQGRPNHGGCAPLPIVDFR